jgi:hypothetical protein
MCANVDHDAIAWYKTRDRGCERPVMLLRRGLEEMGQEAAGQPPTIRIDSQRQ